MKFAEIVDLSEEELVQKLDDSRNELVHLRMKLAARQLENSSQIKKKRKLIAQLLTVQTMKEQGKVKK